MASVAELRRGNIGDENGTSYSSLQTRRSVRLCTYKWPLC